MAREGVCVVCVRDGRLVMARERQTPKGEIHQRRTQEEVTLSGAITADDGIVFRAERLYKRLFAEVLKAFNRHLRERAKDSAVSSGSALSVDD